MKPPAPPRLARSVIVALPAGVLLSLAHAPAGLEWDELGGAAPWRRVAYVLIGAAGALAIGLRGARALGASFSMAAWLFGACAAGFAHTLWLNAQFESRSWLTLAFGLAATLLAAHWVTPATQEPEPDRRRPLRMRAGLSLIGAALGAQLLALSPTFAPLGAAGKLDARLTQFGFLALAALGAFAFAPWLRGRSAAPPLLLAGAVFAGWFSLRALESLADRDGMQRFLSSPPWNLDLTHHGRLDGSLLVAARVLVAPAFALGAGLATLTNNVDRRRVFWSALAGAAAIAVLHPLVVFDGAPDLEAWPAVRVWRAACVVAGAGAALAVTGLREMRRVRWLAAAACLAATALCVLAPAPFAWPLAPIALESTGVVWCASSAVSSASVHSLGDGSRVAVVDGVRISPTRAEAAAEARLLARERRDGRVLLLGPLTKERLAAFRGASLERTGPYREHLASIEFALGAFAAVAAGEAERATPHSASRAHRRAERGEYDLVLALPPLVSATSVASARVPESTRLVAWLDASAPTAHQRWSDYAELALHDLERWCIGVGARGPAVGGVRLEDLTGWERGSLWSRDLARLEATRTATRLARANDGFELAALTQGLALHCAAQVESSPYESREQGVELSDEALELWLADALARQPGRFTRELWEALAEVLVHKRDLERIERFVAPVAAARAPWPALERALAYVDLEMLDPARAAARLAIALTGAPEDVELRRLRGRALLAAGDALAAAGELEFASKLAPQREDIARELAIARVRCGDPRGRAAIDERLAAEPDDPELAPYAGPGPYPPIEARFSPPSRFDEP